MLRRHRIFVVPLPLQSPPPAGDERATDAAVVREDATAEPAAVAPRPRRMVRMRSCRIPASGIDLPDDILVWKIFLRLPSKAVLRCRAVCRSWRGLTSARNFLLAHHRRQPSLPLVALNATDRGLSLSDVDANCNPPILGFDDFDGWRLRASCDGLFLISLADGRFSICNPTTRQCAPLPALTRPNHIDIAALYLHRPSGDYRVLYWKRPAYHILNVGQGRSPRCIGVPADSPEMQTVMRRKDGMSPSWDPPIMLHSCLHWKPAINYAGIVIFHTVAESFRLMPGPAATTTSASCTCLHDMDGSLGFSFFDDQNQTSAIKCWVLEDYENEVWSFRYQIQLSVRSMPHIAYVRHVVSPHDGNFLVCQYSDYCRYMYRCDGNGKLLEELTWGEWDSNITGHWFKESLVKHPFFPTRSATQPHFFRRL